MVLRIANIPHVVVNSSYSCTEATGPLPILRDLPLNDNGNKLPVLVGRSHPKTTIASNSSDGKREEDMSKISSLNSILDYLKSQRDVDLDSHLPNTSTGAEQRLLSKLFIHMINTRLHKCLMVLRYEDRNAWLQVYRNQCLHASRTATTSYDTNEYATTSKRNNPLFPTMRGLLQAWSERVMARKSLHLGGGSSSSMSVEEAKAEARHCYEMLEEQLGKYKFVLYDDASLPFYLLGTTQPTWVDALLWDHLAEAMCDLHLVLILSDFPILVKWFQQIYERYFGSSIKKKSTDTPPKLDWKIWNIYENQINPFQQIPFDKDFGGKKKAKEEFKKFKHALELMQSLSVHDHDLVEVLKVGKEARIQGDTLLYQRQQPSSTTSKDANMKKGSTSEPTALEKARRQQQHNDQIWVSGIVGVLILAAFSNYLNNST